MAILEKMGFPSKCRSCIFFCISIVRFSVLIKGEALFFLKFERALLG